MAWPLAASSLFRGLIVCWLGLGLLFGCQRATAPTAGDVTIAGLSLGTIYTIRVPALPAGTTEAGLRDRIERRLDVVSGQMSTYRPDSELSRFNAFRDDGWFSVSGDTAKVVAAALEVSQRTQGAFDVTVGPLVNLWNFGPDRHPDRIPAAAEITAAKARVGFDKLAVRTDPPALRKTQPDVYVDLSAIAKGFAVDAVGELLEASGVRDYMVEIGGEVRTRGSKRDGSRWRIGIEQPLTENRAIQRVVELGDAALATSGDYRNYFERNGRRYSHLIDPHTGCPIDHALTSISVIADTCMEADAWATGLIILGPDEALRLARGQGLRVFLILRDGERFVERAAPDFPGG